MTKSNNLCAPFEVFGLVGGAVWKYGINAKYGTVSEGLRKRDVMPVLSITFLVCVSVSVVVCAGGGGSPDCMIE